MDDLQLVNTFWINKQVRWQESVLLSYTEPPNMTYVFKILVTNLFLITQSLPF